LRCRRISGPVIPSGTGTGLLRLDEATALGSGQGATVSLITVGLTTSDELYTPMEPRKLQSLLMMTLKHTTSFCVLRSKLRGSGLFRARCLAADGFYEHSRIKLHPHLTENAVARTGFMPHLETFKQHHSCPETRGFISQHSSRVALNRSAFFMVAENR
jgi:hypothetical protein